MKRSNYFNCLIAGTLAVVAVACEGREGVFVSEPVLGFEIAAEQGVDTKAAADETVSEFMLVAEGSDRVIGLGHQISDMPSFAGAVETKAVAYNSESEFAAQNFGVYGWNASNSNAQFFNNEKVSKSAGIWRPEHSKSWPSSTSYTFEAVYPKPSSPLGSTGLTSLTPSSTLGSLAFSYKVQTTAGAQQDLMFACYSGTGNKGKAPLTFTHALTRVKFKVGTLSGISKINSISLAGVYESGNGTVSVSDNKYSYSWTPSGNITVSGNTVKTSLTSGTDLGNDYNFLLIPQDLSTKNVVLTVNMTDAQGLTFNASVTLNSGNWVAGKTNTYTIGITGSDVNVSVSDKVTGGLQKSDLVIANTGTAKAYIRAAIVAGWYNADGEMVQAWSPSTGTFAGLPGTDWTKGSDGFYYYSKPVDGGSATASKLFTSYTRPDAPAVGMHLEMAIIAQAVIYDPDKKRATEAWGSTAASYLQ